MYSRQVAAYEPSDHFLPAASSQAIVIFEAPATLVEIAVSESAHNALVE